MTNFYFVSASFQQIKYFILVFIWCVFAFLVQFPWCFKQNTPNWAGYWQFNVSQHRKQRLRYYFHDVINTTGLFYFLMPLICVCAVWLSCLAPLLWFYSNLDTNCWHFSQNTENLKTKHYFLQTIIILLLQLYNKNCLGKTWLYGKYEVIVKW